MLVTGIDWVCIAKTSDTHFATAVWVKPLDTAEYNESDISIQSAAKEAYNTRRNFSFSFEHTDSTKFETLKEWAADNESVYVYAYFVNGFLFWRQSARFSQSVSGGAWGETGRQRFTITYEGTDLDIQFSINGFRPDFRIAEYDPSTELPITATGTYYTVTAGGGVSFNSTAGDASFTTKSGSVFKLTKTTTTGTVYIDLKVQEDKIPVFEGMKLGLTCDAYNKDANIIGIYLNGYDSSGSGTSAVGTTSNTTGVKSFSEVVTIPANTTYVFPRLMMDANGSSDVVEFDNLQLTYRNVRGYVNG